MKKQLGAGTALAGVLSLGGLWVAAQQGADQRGPFQQTAAQRESESPKKKELSAPTPIDKGKPVVPAQPPVVKQPAKKPSVPDPTEPTGPFQELLIKPEKPGAVPSMPAILVKGRVIGKGFAAALLEVDGKLQMVNKESSFSSGGLTFRVEEVSADEVRLLALPRKEVLVLH